jgi:hypothetical protein
MSVKIPDSTDYITTTAAPEMQSVYQIPTLYSDLVKVPLSASGNFTTTTTTLAPISSERYPSVIAPSGGSPPSGVGQWPEYTNEYQNNILSNAGYHPTPSSTFNIFNPYVHGGVDQLVQFNVSDFESEYASVFDIYNPQHRVNYEVVQLKERSRARRQLLRDIVGSLSEDRGWFGGYY